MNEVRIAEVPQYGVLIEKQYGKDQSLFHEVYEGAIENVADIVLKNNMQFDKEYQQNSSEKNINTIIAFVGGRGTGKSSAMCSFANYLNDKDKNRNAYSWINSEKVRSVIEKTNFYSLPVIDSSQLSERETVIGRITAAMYREYSDKYISQATVEKKQTFIRFAKEVNEIAVMHRTGEWFARGDKLLSDTERISNMSDKVSGLIDAFFAVTEQEKSTYLVVSIDDLDMGIGNTYAIMEEVRKFLFIKNVIVLLTVDDKLLDSVLCSTFDRALDTNHQASGSITRNLSYRYLEKMFPYNRQHHMPKLTLGQLRTISASNFLGDADKYWESTKLIDCSNSADENPPYPSLYSEEKHPSVLDAVLHLIWRKTMLLLVCDKEEEHLLVPRNLRSLCNMVIFLRSMEDVAYAKTDGKDGKVILRCGYEAFCGEDNVSVRETIDHNLREFGQYLVNSISSYGQLNLNSGDERLAGVLRDLVENLLTTQLTKINAKIVGDILQCLFEEEKEKTAGLYYSFFFPVTDHDDLLEAAARYPESISLGDVLYVLGKLDTKTRCEYIRYLVEAIRVLWSVRMTQEFYVNCLGQNDTKNTFITDRKNITEDFSKTVGSFIVNPYKSKFVRKTKEEKISCWFPYTTAKSWVGEGLATIMIAGANDPEKGNFRNYLEGKSLLGIKVSQKEEKIYIHPMVLFTNLMAIDKQNTKEVNCLKELVGLLEEFICFKYIAVPFFSLDYMYRFYENVHKVADLNPVSNLNDFLQMILTGTCVFSGVYNTTTAYEAICIRMAYYIPHEFLKKVIINPIKELRGVIDEYSLLRKQKIIEKMKVVLDSDRNKRQKIVELQSTVKELGPVSDTEIDNPLKKFAKQCSNSAMTEDDYKFTENEFKERLNKRLKDIEERLKKIRNDLKEIDEK